MEMVSFFNKMEVVVASDLTFISLERLEVKSCRWVRNKPMEYVPGEILDACWYFTSIGNIYVSEDSCCD